MPVPPPPPPPPPMPGFGFGGGPPPPPPGGAPMPKPSAAPSRGALLGDISSGGFKLKKAVTNDRSAPIVEKKPSGPTSSGLARPPTTVTPPIPGPAASVASAAANRLRSNSASTADASTGSAMATAPQLGGLFAGGMPKLRKAKGAVETGADRDSSYMANSSTSALPAARPPQIPGRPSMPGAPAPSAPPILPTGRKNTSHTHERPASAIATTPPPRRRLSLHGLWDTNKLSSPAGPPAPRGAPPPPPPPPGARPPPPPVTSRAPPVPPPSRGTPPPPPSSSAPPPPHANGLNGLPKVNAIAAAVARKVSGVVHHNHPSPATVPPSIPPPPPPPPPSAFAPVAPVSAPPPPPPPGRGIAPPAANVRSPNPNSFTLVNNGAKRGERIVIDDKRWKWKPESDLPKPQEFKGLRKVYRSGRGSSVPLDLSAYE